MPIKNDFQHATYSRADPGDRLNYLEFFSGAPPDSPAWLDAMVELGRLLTLSGVRVVLFLHGTFLGTDLFGVQRLDEVGGLKRGYSRGIPGIDALLSLMREETNGLSILKGGQTLPFQDDDQTKKLIDDQTGDAGNFTTTYIDLFKKAINRNAAEPIACIRTLWSCEHHHLGRAWAAVRLLERLKILCNDLNSRSGNRILVLAHGQAGLLLALASNLLAPSASAARDQFLEILKLGQLSSDLLNGVSLDIVTFGTPVRYGWDPSGIDKLLHIVNHRPMRIDGKRWLAKMELPQITMEMPIAWGGDYVQQLAIAGSDAVPSSPEAQAANRALWEILEPFDGFERWLECTRKAVRCQNDGHCLLVDYKDAGSHNPRDHIYGHAAYTRLNAMLFNTTEIVRMLYQSTSIS